MEVCPADPGEKLCSWLVSKASDGNALPFHPLLEGIAVEKLQTTTSGGNPKSVDRMTATLMCRSPLGGVILGGVCVL